MGTRLGYAQIECGILAQALTLCGAPSATRLPPNTCVQATPRFRRPRPLRVDVVQPTRIRTDTEAPPLPQGPGVGPAGHTDDRDICRNLSAKGFLPPCILHDTESLLEDADHDDSGLICHEPPAASPAQAKRAKKGKRAKRWSRLALQATHGKTLLFLAFFPPFLLFRRPAENVASTFLKSAAVPPATISIDACYVMEEGTAALRPTARSPASQRWGEKDNLSRDECNTTNHHAVASDVGALRRSAVEPIPPLPACQRPRRPVFSSCVPLGLRASEGTKKSGLPMIVECARSRESPFTWLRGRRAHRRRAHRQRFHMNEGQQRWGRATNALLRPKGTIHEPMGVWAVTCMRETCATCSTAAQPCAHAGGEEGVRRRRPPPPLADEQLFRWYLGGSTQPCSKGALH